MLKSISAYVLASAAGVAVALSMLSGIFMVTEVTGTAMETGTAGRVRMFWWTNMRIPEQVLFRIRVMLSQ